MIRLEFTGNIACDCEKRIYNNSTYYYMRVAVNVGKERTDFITCFISWNAENLYKYLTKGKPVFVSGFPSISVFTDKDGKQQTRFDVNVNNLEMFSRKSDDGSTQNQQTAAQQTAQPAEQQQAAAQQAAQQQPKNDDLPF
jgi:single stranded DNA-binding protein